MFLTYRDIMDSFVQKRSCFSESVRPVHAHAALFVLSVLLVNSGTRFCLDAKIGNFSPLKGGFLGLYNSPL